jgi:hypothetical protein
MSVLANLARDREAYRQQSALESETELIAEYDALRRAYMAALASNNVEGALLWARRANNIVREMVKMQDRATE